MNLFSPAINRFQRLLEQCISPFMIVTKSLHIFYSNVAMVNQMILRVLANTAQRPEQKKLTSFITCNSL